MGRSSPRLGFRRRYRCLFRRKRTHRAVAAHRCTPQQLDRRRCASEEERPFDRASERARVTRRASVREGAQAAASLPPSLPPSLLRCCGCARLTHSRNLSGEPLPPPFCHPSPSETVYPTADESARGVRACALPACWRVACSRVRALHLGRGDLYIFGLKRSPQKIFAPPLDSIDGLRHQMCCWRAGVRITHKAHSSVDDWLLQLLLLLRRR